MISPVFYSGGNTARYFFNKRLEHFPIKSRTRVLLSVPYTIKSGDTIYSIAADWFGKDSERYWTIIVDLNNYIRFDELFVGDTILLPKVILNETVNRLPDYEQNTSTAVKI